MEYAGRKEKFLIGFLTVLFYMTAATTWLTWNVYAKYTTSSSGGDGARVARFEVTEAGIATQVIAVELAPGETRSYEVSVTNKSETAIDYRITAVNQYNNLPLTIEMYELNGDGSSTNESESAKHVDMGKINANDMTKHRYQLRISWDKNTPGNSSPEYAGKADLLTVTLEAAQAD